MPLRLPYLTNMQAHNAHTNAIYDYTITSIYCNSVLIYCCFICLYVVNRFFER